MTTRAQLKRRALDGLGGYYWSGFLVCLIAMLLGGAGGGNPLSGLSGGARAVSSGGDTGFGSGEISSSTALVIMGILMTVIVTMWVVGILWSSLVGNVIRVGSCRYFVESQEQQRSAGLGMIFSGFTGGNYLNVVKVMFMKGLFEALWSLLLVIPGVIKSYEYYLVPYLLAETPDLPYREALRISREMMDGHKWRAFVLELSFIGWLLLGSLLCGLGVLFVRPYQSATFAEFYLDLCRVPGAENVV